jgi:predicted CoA-binding protein
VIHDEAVARARAAGVKCVQNDCIFREHAARPDCTPETRAEFL